MLSDAEGTARPAEGAEIKKGQSVPLGASFSDEEAQAIRAERQVHVQFKVTTTDGKSWRVGRAVRLNGDELQH